MKQFRGPRRKGFSEKPKKVKKLKYRANLYFKAGHAKRLKDSLDKVFGKSDSAWTPWRRVGLQ